MGPGRARRERVRAALRVAVEMTGRALASQPALVLLGPTGRFTASLEIQGERSAKRHPVSRGDHRTRYPNRPRLYLILFSAAAGLGLGLGLGLCGGGISKEKRNGLPDLRSGKATR